MALMRSGFQALVNAVWGLVSGGLPVSSRTVTAQGGSVASVTTVATVTGNVNGTVGGVTGNVTGSVGSVAGNVTGSVGSVAGHINGSVLGGMAGAVGGVIGNVTGNVTGSVGSVTAPVTVASGSRGTIRRRIKATSSVTEGNAQQTASLGVTVTEALCQLRMNGTTVAGAVAGDGSAELINSDNVRVYRSSGTGTTVFMWELTEMYG